MDTSIKSWENDLSKLTEGTSKYTKASKLISSLKKEKQTADSDLSAAKEARNNLYQEKAKRDEMAAAAISAKAKNNEFTEYENRQTAIRG